MSGEVAVSGNTEQEGKYVRKLFTSNAVLEHPAPDNTAPDRTAADWAAQAEAMLNADEETIQDEEPCSFHIQMDSAFASITPIKCLAQPEIDLSSSIIRRPHADELITIIDDPIVVDCCVVDLRCDCGSYAGELCYPPDHTLREELKVPTRPVALYPCISYPDKRLIFPYVLDRRNSARNSQDTSLEGALGVAASNWTRLWYDDDTRSFQHRRAEQELAAPPEYPGFVWDCLNAIGECFDDEPEHSLQALIREQQRLHMDG
jgi:hypothetical protein